MEGRFVPGQKLDFNDLMEQFNCSRTPVREALQALSLSGLVRVEPKRGSFVSELDIIELTERFEVAAEIEGLCASLAATRATLNDLTIISAAQQNCEIALKAGDIEDYYQKNTIFHQTVYDASGNNFLASEARRLQAMMQPYRRGQMHIRGRMMHSFAEHREIFEAIEQGAPELAWNRMRNHIKIQGERFHQLVALRSNLKNNFKLK